MFWNIKTVFLCMYVFVTDVHSSRETKTVLVGSDLFLRCSVYDIGPETGLNWMRVAINKTGFTESKLIYRDDSHSLFTTDSRFNNFHLISDDICICRIELKDERNYISSSLKSTGWALGIVIRSFPPFFPFHFFFAYPQSSQISPIIFLLFLPPLRRACETFYLSRCFWNISASFRWLKKKRNMLLNNFPLLSRNTVGSRFIQEEIKMKK